MEDLKEHTFSNNVSLKDGMGNIYQKDVIINYVKKRKNWIL